MSSSLPLNDCGEKGARMGDCDGSLLPLLLLSPAHVFPPPVAATCGLSSRVSYFRSATLSGISLTTALSWPAESSLDLGDLLVCTTADMGKKDQQTQKLFMDVCVPCTIVHVKAEYLCDCCSAKKK